MPIEKNSEVAVRNFLTPTGAFRKGQNVCGQFDNPSLDPSPECFTYSQSPDLNPQENVWAWAEDYLRKSERKRDTVAVFKRRVAASCQRYPSKLALVPSMAGRMAKCVKLRGANIGK